MKKKAFRIISVFVCICLIVPLVVFKSSVYAENANLSNSQSEKSVTWEDVAAGLATPDELYNKIDPSAVPDAVGIETAHERMHIERLYAEEGDNLNQVVFRNADGTNTLYLFDYPVKYVNERGSISDISLEVSADKTKSGSFKSTANVLQTTFSKTAAEGINLSYENLSITLIPLEQNKSANIGLSSTAVKQNNKTVSYAYNDKTSLEYSLTYKGFKEDIVVKEYTGQTEYKFKLLTGGLTLTKIGESYYLVDALNKIRASIGDIIIFTADERNNTLGRLSFEVVKARQEYIMTIHIDGDYLRDEKTLYPIRIDPTIEIDYDSAGTGAIHDVTLNSNNISNTASTTLMAGRRSDTWGISRILMKFPGLNLMPVQSAANIIYAAVELRDILCEAEALTIYCHPFTGNVWDENTVNWANVNANSYGANMYSSKEISYSNGTQQTSSHRYAFSVTTVVRGWKTGNYSQDKGLIFKASNTVENGTASNYKTFGSYNRSSYRPALYVNYSVDTGNSNFDFSGLYYINNMNSGYYLYRGTGNTNVHGERGRISILSDNCTWRIDKVEGGSYVIRNNKNLNQYLGVLEQSGYIGTRRITLQDAAVPNSCRWDITIAATGGCLIRNKYNSNYLYTSSNNVYTTATLGSSTSYAEYTPKVWRIIKNSSLNSQTEVSPTTFFYSKYNFTGTNELIQYRLNSSGIIWADRTDFIYSGYNSNLISIDYTGRISFLSQGQTQVTVTHKPTAILLSFTVNVYTPRNNLGTITVWNNIENNMVGCWPIEHEPQKIYISTLGTGSYSNVVSACQYAVDMWNQTLSLNMSITNNADEADITIVVGQRQELIDHEQKNDKDWTLPSNVVGMAASNSHCDGDYYMLGNSKKLSSVITSAKIWIVTESSFTLDNYKSVVLHEMAHALGYVGHSNITSDVMYYLVGTVYQLSDNEKSHLQQVYNLR